MDKKTIYTAIKPTGILTLGGYIGVAQNLKSMCEEYNAYICVADMHALTINPDPKELRENTYKLVALYLALGLDTDKCTLYLQSQVHEHADINWILSNYTMYGEATRMTQFKDHQAKDKEINMGLLNYPILMAGDILLYDTDIVPVGIDQKQHVELCRNIAIRFNHKMGDTFKVPDVLIRSEGYKICGLSDPTKKMSKSNRGDTGSIFIEDTPEEILKKVKRAVTDSDNEIKYDVANKPGVSNLLTIYACLKGITLAHAEEHFKGMNYGTLKLEVAGAIIDELKPLQEKYYAYLNDKEYLDKILLKGKLKAEVKAKEVLHRVYEKVGLVQSKNN